MSPDGAVARDGRPVPASVWTMLAALAANMFSGYSDQLGLPIGPDRVLLAATVVLLLLDRRRRRLAPLPVYWVMGALVVWTALSAIGAGTLTRPAGAYALLDRIVVPFLMFPLGAIVLGGERERGLLLRLLALLGVYLGATAVLEVVGPSSLVWPRYVMDPDLGILFGRARGPFLNAEADGMVMGMALFASCVLAARSRGVWRVVAAGAVVLTGVGVLLCLTRSVWLATAVAGLVVGWLVPVVRRRLPLVGAGLAGLLGVVLLAVPPAAAALTERFTMVSSVYDRQNTNAAALRIIAAQPLTGIGWNRYLDVGTDWVRQADDYPVSNVHIEVHNVFLSRAAETGVLGTVLWVLAMALGPALALRGLRRGAPRRDWSLLFLASFVYWGVVSMTSPNSYPLANDLVWLLGGVAAADRVLLPDDAVADDALAHPGEAHQRRTTGAVPGGAP